MAVIRTPDGRRLRVPDDATPEQIQQVLASQGYDLGGGDPAPATPGPATTPGAVSPATGGPVRGGVAATIAGGPGASPVAPETVEQEDPFGGGGLYRQYLTGVGDSLRRTGRGLRQLVADADAGFMRDTDNPYFADMQERRQRRTQELREQEAQIREEEAPKRDSLAYRWGDIVGSGAQLIGPGLAVRGTALANALMPRTLAGNTALGGAVGAAQPVAEEESRGLNTAIGAGAGGAGHLAARALSQFTPQARQAMRQADDLGLNLRGTPGEQVHQLGGAGQNMLPESRGAGMVGIRESLQNARTAAKQGVDDAYSAAMGTRAAAPAGSVAGFAQTARHRLIQQEGFDLADPQLHGVAKRLDELEKISTTPGAKAVQLRALEGWRKRINAMSPNDGTPAMAASQSLKRQYDDFMTDMFNRDMIDGDQAALQAWRDARAKSAAFHSTFNDNDIIRNLATKPDLTQEQMRGWLLNASSAKAPSGAVIRRLNEILGPDSAEMTGLRAEVAADLLEPLVKRRPNIQQFLDKYDTYTRNNPTVMRELFPDGVGDLEQIKRFAEGVAKRPGSNVVQQGDPQNSQMFGVLRRFLEAKFFGHGIAEGSARMGAARSAIDRLRESSVGRRARLNILREYLGADPKAPMFGAPQAAIGAAMSERPAMELDIVGGTPVPDDEIPTEAMLRALRGPGPN